MKKPLIIAALTLAAVVPAVAYAGYRSTHPVTVETARGRAFGAVGSAHNSTDTTQSISCFLQGKATGDIDGGCAARDATGNSATCKFLNKPGLAAAVQAITDDSFVLFSWVGSDCQGIMVVNGSQFDFKL